jgi:hypothetical protein
MSRLQSVFVFRLPQRVQQATGRQLLASLTCALSVAFAMVASVRFI